MTVVNVSITDKPIHLAKKSSGREPRLTQLPRIQHSRTSLPSFHVQVTNTQVPWEFYLHRGGI